jgi:hypothetical protein
MLVSGASLLIFFAIQINTTHHKLVAILLPSFSVEQHGHIYYFKSAPHPPLAHSLACHQVTPQDRQSLVLSTHNRQNAENMEHEAATTEERGGVRADQEEKGDGGATACPER